MKSIIHLLALLFIASHLNFSCKSEPKEMETPKISVDSTLFTVENILYQNQIDSVFSRYKFNGSIAVFRNGHPVYEKSQGFRDFKEKLPLDSNSIFAIGSLSKQFTAVMLLMQADAGRFNISDPVSKFLPEFDNPVRKTITVVQLLAHTSGVSDNGDGLNSKPGEEFNYTNKGYRLLGKILEKITGKSYDQNASELFARAGLKNTYTPSLFKGSPNFAGAHVGKIENAQKIENMPLRLEAENISVPAGGILSTVRDLDQWNRSLFDGNLLKPETLKQMTTQVTTRPHYVLGKVGYGFGIMGNPSSPNAYFHSGYVKGSPSLSIYYPDSKTSVIILSNIADESKSKEGFFRPHAELKNISDAIELSVSQSRKKLTEQNQE